MVMKHIQTFEFINEAVKVEVERYKRSHQKNPKGYGQWAFSYNRDGKEHFFVPKSMDYKDAVKWAKEEAKRDGEGYIYVMESVNEGKNSAVWTSPKTGKSYDIQKNGNRWEMDIMKKGSSIYDKVTTIKRKTPQELKDWLDGYKIDSQWMEHLLESVNEGVIGIKTEGGFKPKDLSDALDKAKVKYKMNRLSTTLTVLNLDKNYFEDAKKIVDDLGLNIMMAKESVNEGLSVTFEFPDERKAKQFNLDIENSAIGLGDQVGNRVTVTDVDPKWRSTVKKHMKKNKGKAIIESVNEGKKLKKGNDILVKWKGYSKRKNYSIEKIYKRSGVEYLHLKAKDGTIIELWRYPGDTWYDEHSNSVGIEESVNEATANYKKVPRIEAKHIEPNRLATEIVEIIESELGISIKKFDTHFSSSVDEQGIEFRAEYSPYYQQDPKWYSYADVKIDKNLYDNKSITSLIKELRKIKKIFKESVNEAKEVEVTQEMWDKEWKIRKTFGKEYEEHFAKRTEAAMSKAKNEEMAENWAFINWKQLPGKADGMTIKESLNEAKVNEGFDGEELYKEIKKDRKTKMVSDIDDGSIIFYHKGITKGKAEINVDSFTGDITIEVFSPSSYHGGEWYGEQVESMKDINKQIDIFLKAEKAGEFKEMLEAKVNEGEIKSDEDYDVDDALLFESVNEGHKFVKTFEAATQVPAKMIAFDDEEDESEEEKIRKREGRVPGPEGGVGYAGKER